MSNYTPESRTAHGAVYWLLVGWWWAPAKWAGRVTLWLVLWPVGLWRSITNSKKKQASRQRRGYEKSQR